MAYSKTTPGQIAAQLAAGAALFGTLYYSFYKKEAALPGDPTPPILGATPQAQIDSLGTSEAEIVAALDREAQNTAGKVWAAQRDGSGGERQ